jgi:hypothetical protein
MGEGDFLEGKAVYRGQIVAVLREEEAGARVSDLCRNYGMSDANYYNWKARYAGMTAVCGRPAMSSG